MKTIDELLQEKIIKQRKQAAIDHISRLENGETL